MKEFKRIKSASGCGLAVVCLGGSLGLFVAFCLGGESSQQKSCPCWESKKNPPGFMSERFSSVTHDGIPSSQIHEERLRAATLCINRDFINSFRHSSARPGPASPF